MDVNIASIHISVHRVESEQKDQRPLLSPAERAANRAQQIARAERKRQEMLTWLALHGGR